MPFLRSPVPLIALVLLGACSAPPASPEPVEIAPSPVTTPEPPQAPEPRPIVVHAADPWVGSWHGPEGLFLEVSPGTAVNTVRLRLQDNLDGAADYVGILTGDAIQFERAGRPETVRRGTGLQTGFSALRSLTDCLIVREGEEGYCRRPEAPDAPKAG